MSHLDDVGDRDGWRCWICDEPVDRDIAAHDGRSASVDQRVTKAQAKKKGKDRPVERLAHAGCNTGKGAVEPVVPWDPSLFVVDPAPIITSAGRLERKGGREAMARCPTLEDAQDAADWLVDRMSRLHPGLAVSSRIDEGGDSYLVSLCV